MSSFALKLIAIITMLIDHIAYSFVGVIDPTVYYVMRCIGRIAMPLFCFMIAEGLFHTRNAKKYALRLLMFAFISEIPYDLMGGRVSFGGIITGDFIGYSAQNVFFTLFLGLIGIMLFDTFAARNQKWLSLVSILAAAFAAELINSDYGLWGVYFIFAFYIFRNNRALKAAGFSVGVLAYTSYNVINGGRLSLWTVIPVFELVSIVPIMLYNGKRGPGGKFLKYFFYAFYPAHMLILAIIRYAVYGI